MRIFHNPGTRQMIVVTDDFACSVFLQANETPEAKAIEVMRAYQTDHTNVSVCPETDLGNTGDSLPEEHGPEQTEAIHDTEPTNGDGKTE